MNVGRFSVTDESRLYLMMSAQSKNHREDTAGVTFTQLRCQRFISQIFGCLQSNVVISVAQQAEAHS